MIENEPLEGRALSPNFEEVRDLVMSEVESEYDQGEPGDIYKLAIVKGRSYFKVL